MVARKILPALIVILLILFGYQLVQKRNSVYSPQNSVTKSDKQNPTSDLSLVPTNLTVRSGEEKEVAVMIESPEQVTGVQMVLTYDPNVLEVKDVKPGDFLDQASALVKQIDNNSGRTDFQVGTLKPKAGKGQVMLITLQGKAKGKTVLSLKNGSRIAILSRDTDDLKSANEAQVTIN